MTTLVLDTGLPAPRRVVDAVYERTDGVPLHIEELLGALDADARASGFAVREATVPDTIEDAVLARLSHRSSEAQAVARAGAIIGRCFVPEVLAGVLDVAPETIEAPLQELIDDFIPEPPGARGLIDFRHQLLRDAIYRSVTVGDRRRLHARAGEFGAHLEGQSDIHSSLHYERAGLRRRAFETALAGARDAARVSAHREAFELYRRAVTNLPDDLGPGDRADALQRMARGHVATEEPWRPLTVREFAVARLVSEGRTNAEIAESLGIAPKTASSHVEHILAKLGASRRAGSRPGPAVWSGARRRTEAFGSSDPWTGRPPGRWSTSDPIDEATTRQPSNGTGSRPFDVRNPVWRRRIDASGRRLAQTWPKIACGRPVPSRAGGRARRNRHATEARTDATVQSNGYEQTPRGHAPAASHPEDPFR